MNILYIIIFLAYNQNAKILYSGAYSNTISLFKYQMNIENLCVISYRVYKYLQDNNYKYSTDDKIMSIDEVYNFAINKLGQTKVFDKYTNLFNYLDVTQQKDFIYLISIEKLFKKCISFNIFEYCKKKNLNIFKTCDYLDIYKNIETNLVKYDNLFVYFSLGFNATEINIIDAYNGKLLMNFNNTDDVYIRYK